MKDIDILRRILASREVHLIGTCLNQAIKPLWGYWENMLKEGKTVYPLQDIDVLINVLTELRAEFAKECGIYPTYLNRKDLEGLGYEFKISYECFNPGYYWELEGQEASEDFATVEEAILSAEENALSETQHRCDNCQAISNDDELNEIQDFGQRVSPGGTVPSGECPECGALCFPIEPLPLSKAVFDYKGWRIRTYRFSKKATATSPKGLDYTADSVEEAKSIVEHYLADKP